MGQSADEQTRNEAKPIYSTLKYSHQVYILLHPFMIRDTGLKLPVIFEPSGLVLFDANGLSISPANVGAKTGKNKRHTSVVLCLSTTLAVFRLLLLFATTYFQVST